MSGGSSGSSGSGAAPPAAVRDASGAIPPTTYSVLAEVPLGHLPNNAKICVQRQRGGYVPEDAVQFFLAWAWDAPGGSTAWKGGGSIQAEQIPDVIAALARAYKSETGQPVPGLGGVDGSAGDAGEETGRTGTFADLYVADEGEAG